MADDSQERRERTFEEYVRYSRRQIEILIAPGLLADVETLAQAYLPYLLDGDPEEPTVSRIPGGPTYVREGAPAGMGTPPEFWVRLLIGQAEEGNRGAERALELAHHIYRTAQLAAWREAVTAHLETIRWSARLLASWMAARSENLPAPRRRRPPTPWRDRQLRLLVQCLYIPTRESEKYGLSSQSLLPLKRFPDAKRKPALCVFDAVLEAWNDVRATHPDFPRLTYYAVEKAWRATRPNGIYPPFPDLYAGTGIDPEQHTEAVRRWMEDRMEK